MSHSGDTFMYTGGGGWMISLSIHNEEQTALIRHDVLTNSGSSTKVQYNHRICILLESQGFSKNQNGIWALEGSQPR